MSEGDTDTARKESIYTRLPFMEVQLENKDPYLDIVEAMREPRTMMTHLPFTFFNKSIIEAAPRVIVIMRNPRDMLVSSYHYYKNCLDIDWTWEEIFEVFKNKGLIFGDWFDSVSSWYTNVNKRNFLFLHYEEMNTNAEKVVRRILHFLNKELPDDVLQKILDYTSFQGMKTNPVANLSTLGLFKPDGEFMRKGSVGDWKNTFTVAQKEYMEEVYEKQLDQLQLNFQFQ